MSFILLAYISSKISCEAMNLDSIAYKVVAVAVGASDSLRVDGGYLYSWEDTSVLKQKTGVPESFIILASLQRLAVQ